MSDTESSAEPAPLPEARNQLADRTGWRLWIIAPVIALAAFMEILDISIANVSLEHIAGNLSASRDQSTWVLTSYLVTNAIVLPMSGWFSKRLGRKRFFMGCIASFAVASLFCGLAPSLDTLILARTIQGAAGGGLQPTSQAILADTFPASQRGMAFAFYGVAAVFAPALGPALGGWITQNFSWRWVFLINVPVGILLLALVATIVPRPAKRERSSKRGRIDYLGFGLLAVGMGSLQVFLDRGQQNDWFASHVITALAATCIIAFVAFVLWEMRQQQPVVEVRLLGRASFATANLMMFALGFVLFGSTELLPQYVQSLLGFTATYAGLVIMPGGLTAILLMPLAGKLTDKVDPRWLIVFGLSIGALALHYMATLFDTSTDFWTIAVVRVGLAAGLPFLFLPITTAGYIGIPEKLNDEASALINMSRNVGGSVGISLLTTTLTRRSQYHQSVLVGNTTPFDQQYQAMVQAMTQHFTDAGMAAADALQHAHAAIYRLVSQQAHMLAYIDDFWMLSMIFLALIPLTLVLRNKKQSLSDAQDDDATDERRPSSATD